MKKIAELQAEYDNAIASGLENESRDLELILQSRTRPDSVDALTLAGAKNRQSQRRYQRKFGVESVKRIAYPRVRQTQNLRHPASLGVGMIVTDSDGNDVRLTGHIGTGFVAKGVKDDLWAGVSVATEAPCVLGRSHMFVVSPPAGPGETESQKSVATAGPDTERMLRASVAVEAARQFLATLDRFVAEDATEADYAQARVALDAALEAV